MCLVEDSIACVLCSLLFALLTISSLRSNPVNSGTLGAPILILTNEYPRFRYLHIKLQVDNATFGLGGLSKYKIAQLYCLKLSSNLEDDGDDDKPALLFEPTSPELREPSYVEITTEVRLVSADRLKSWCVPPVNIQQGSMVKLWAYMKKLPQLRRPTPPRYPGSPASPVFTATGHSIAGSLSPYGQHGQWHGLQQSNMPVPHLPRRQPLGEISANAMNTYRAPVMTGGMQSGTPSPLIDQAPYNGLMRYYQHPGYIPTTSPTFPIFQAGIYEQGHIYAHGWNVTQPYHRAYPIPPAGAPEPENAPAADDSISPASESTPTFVHTRPLPGPFMLPALHNQSPDYAWW